MQEHSTELGSYKSIMDSLSSLAPDERAVLIIASLFPKFISIKQLNQLREPPLVAGLTESFRGITDVGWYASLEMLDQRKLLRISHTSSGSMLVAVNAKVRGPLFDALRAEQRAGILQILPRLFDSYRADPRLQKHHDTISLGCLSGRYQEAFDTAYREYVVDGGLPIVNAGKQRAELSTLELFFDGDWSSPKSGLTNSSVALLQHDAGITLRGRGRLAEATVAFKYALQRYMVDDNFYKASMCANHLAVALASSCRHSEALAYALVATNMGEKSGNSEYHLRGLTGIGSILHYCGRFRDSNLIFSEAERVAKGRLMGFPGSRKIALLLTEGQYLLAADYARLILPNPNDKGKRFNQLAYSNLRVQLSVADFHCTDKRYCRQSHFFESALSDLERIGMREDLARARLQRAALVCECTDESLDTARKDISKVAKLTFGSDMRVHHIDNQLLRCRVAIRQRAKNRALHHLNRVSGLVKKTSAIYRPDKLGITNWLSPKFANVVKPGEVLGYYRLNGQIRALQQELSR